MHQKVLNFIKYNNAFTIIFVLCFFSFGISFAASDDMRESVYASSETVVSVDNSLIVSADLDNFSFNLRISSITEDDKNYYAVYSYRTLIIENGFWQDKEVEKILTVSKEALGGRDLGLFVARELGENINYELSYLKRVQKLERENGESQKIVTTEYSGLIGKLLDPKEQIIEGYDPVIPEPVEEAPVIVEANPSEVIISTPYSEPLVEPTQETVTPLPAPQEMIDETLTQEVVEELLTATSTPEAVSEQLPPAPPSSPDLPVDEVEATADDVEPAPEPIPELVPEPVVEVAPITTDVTPQN